MMSAASAEPPQLLEQHASLVEQYAAMSHVFQPRLVDLVLRALDLVLGACAAIAAGPIVIVIAVVLKLSSPRLLALDPRWQTGFVWAKA